MTDEELERYSRHILLPQISYEGQLKLSENRILLFGAGGLGCPTAMYLGASGIGQLTICDPDLIDLSNLQRQIGFTSNDIGSNKASTLAKRIAELNPTITINALTEIPSDLNLLELFSQSQVVVDATDNFESRFRLNKYCVKTKTPLISGAAIKMTGHIFVYDPTIGHIPCYHCLYSEYASEAGQTCEDRGVFAPLVGIVGSMLAAETLKLLLGFGRTFNGTLLQIDVESWQWRNIPVLKDFQCSVCNPN